MRLIALSLGFAVLTLCGQVQPLTPEHDPPPKHTVTGTVVNAVTGEPIKRVLVRYSQASTLTGADGRFRFEDVPEGPVQFSPQKPGYFGLIYSPSVGEVTEQGPFTVGADKNDFQLKLYPAARIAGQVMDDDGEPIENTLVIVKAERIDEGRREWPNREAMNTDDDGRFRVEGLMPGRYLLQVTGKALPRKSPNAAPMVIAPAYYPDARDLVSAQPIELQAGQEFVADLHLKKERGYKVSGRIAGAIGPLLADQEGQSVQIGAEHWDDKTGEFSFESIPSGNWMLMLGDGSGRKEFVVNHADVNGLVIEARQPAKIPVTVTAAASSVADPNLRLELVPSGGGNVLVGQQNAGAREITFVDVPPGRYRLRVRVFSGECLEAASFGATDLLRDYLVVGPGPQQPLMIRLTGDCAQVEVSAKDNREGAVFAYVVMVPDSPVGDPTVSPIGLKGKPVLSVTPRTYQVYAFSSLDGLEYANPEAMRGFASEMVHLEAGQTKAVSLNVIQRKKE